MKKIIRQLADGGDIKLQADFSVPVLGPVVACRHPGMFPELLVEVRHSCKSAFKDDLVYLVVCLAKQIACLVGPYLVHIVYKPAAGAPGEEAAE